LDLWRSKSFYICIMMSKNDNAEALLQQLATVTPKNAITGELQQQLAAHINDLINTDFERLVQWLYRMDIDELKLKTVLQEYPGRDAGEMIAALMIERQLQKIKSRREFRQGDNDIDEQEKW
jgi:hypothetical protein